MSTPTRAIHPIYSLLPTDVEGFDALAELALDMRSSWNHATDQVWRQLDPVLWELTHNPWVVLQTVSRDQIEHVLADTVFRNNVDDLVQSRRQAAEAPAWFQQQHTQGSLNCVAYFSMEFMLSEALPIYSGGLGNVAGAQLKAAGGLYGAHDTLRRRRGHPPARRTHPVAAMMRAMTTIDIYQRRLVVSMATHWQFPHTFTPVKLPLPTCLAATDVLSAGNSCSRHHAHGRRTDDCALGVSRTRTWPASETSNPDHATT